MLMPVLPMMFGGPVSVVLFVPMMTLVFHRCQGSMVHVGQHRRTEQANCD